MWKFVARFIIRKRAYILAALGLLIVGCLINFKVIFTQTEAELLPKENKLWVEFQNFRKTFGQEDNAILLGVNDARFFEPQIFSDWIDLLNMFENQSGVLSVMAIDRIQKPVKDSLHHQMNFEPVFNGTTKLYPLDSLKQNLSRYPFYEGFMYNKKFEAFQTLVYLDPTIVDTPLRSELVLTLEEDIERFEQKHQISVVASGIPVIRTHNAIELKKEAVFYILGSLLVTCLIFFFFFRSLSATLITISIVLIAVLFSFSLLNWLHYEVNLLTALIPPLLVVIGVPNCIFLINKYQHEYKIHYNKIKALQRMIIKVGNASLMTNLTTAFGFFTFIFTDSETLREFGIVASINIVGVFLLSILIVPIGLSFMSDPKPADLKHFEMKWIVWLIDKMEHWVKYKRKYVYLFTVVLVVLSLIGISKIKTSGNMLDDLAKDTQYYRDINFFDTQFGGVLPLEIMVDTQHAKGALQVETLQKINQMTRFIDSLGLSSKAMAIDRLAKFVKQAYYNDNVAYYSLPDKREKNFIFSYLKNSIEGGRVLQNYLDSTGQKTRITTYVQNLDTEQLSSLFSKLQEKKEALFPADQYTTFLTGASYVFLNGTYFLSKNLLISIVLAILLIAIFMAVMFQDVRMIVVSLLPNLLPIITTAGFMGFLEIPLKPSTILVFSIAFGIAVDDTIHFLSKYRQELKFSKGNIPFSVINALRETGISMFYTSVVLFFGFGIFMLSDFGGTVALGGLVALTLLVAVVSDLVLLPSLLFSFDKLTNKHFVAPEIDLFEEEEDGLGELPRSH